MSAPETIKTPLTEMLGIKYPIMLAGMNVAAGPKLAAAVSNAGGIGTIGGVGYSPEFLREQIRELKSKLDDPNLPFGIDLLLPKVGEGARKTNYDYTGGKLGELTDIVIEEGASLFVSAVGVPPKAVVQKLQKAGIPVMNMIGAPKHVKYCIEAGIDIICAQGGEGGGHTGDVATSILIPKVVDLCKGHKSPIDGKPMRVVAAGGIFDGRGLAMALSLGADAVWVGTRFVASKEAGAPKRHKDGVVSAGYHDTIRSIIFTGRPLRIKKSDYIMNWEDNRQAEIKTLTSEGKIPAIHEMTEKQKAGEEVDFETRMQATPLLMGQNAGAISDVKPALDIMNEMMTEAIAVLRKTTMAISATPTAVTAKL